MEFGIRTPEGRVIVGPDWSCEADVVASFHGHADGRPASAHGDLVVRDTPDSEWRDARPPCPFCRIVAGEAPATLVAGDWSWVAFEPLNPHAPGHLLFVPRRHVSDATEDPVAAAMVFAAAASYLGGRQGNLLTSVGADATQTVMHLHVHLIPRGPDDGLHHDWPWMRP